ncbi:MAG: YraN family protein [Candidatus Cloacimonadota bacterium]|nr:MAG: YraN family protein [Candidatus Cloacimonadota bacterium]
MEKDLSKIGENLAATYLISKKYNILLQNFHTQYGEIDIISEHNNTLIFVEVKTRSSSLKNAFNSVSYAKQKRISQTASIFLSKFPQYEDYQTRFDVIAILFHPQNNNFTLKHLKNAFSPPPLF